MHTSQFGANQCNGPANGFLAEAGEGWGLGGATNKYHHWHEVETYIFSLTLLWVPSMLKIAKSDHPILLPLLLLLMHFSTSLTFFSFLAESGLKFLDHSTVTLVVQCRVAFSNDFCWGGKRSVDLFQFHNNNKDKSQIYSRFPHGKRRQ